MIINMTSAAKKDSIRAISPVLQFALLLTPIVMSCFYLVYALTGWILEGRDKLNWSIEATGVAVWVGSGIIAYSLLVMLYVRWKGGARFHPLNLSSWVHIVLAVLLTVSVFVTVKA